MSKNEGGGGGGGGGERERKGERGKGEVGGGRREWIMREEKQRYIITYKRYMHIKVMTHT